VRNGSSNGEHRLAARYRKDTVKAQVSKVVGEAEQNVIVQGTAGGDARRLRGLPAIGPNVTGAIPGTVPHALREPRG